MRKTDNWLRPAAVLLLLTTEVHAQGAPTARTPVSIVQGQIEAFNGGDAAAFASFYADDIEIFDLGPETKPSLSGREALLARYEPMFQKYHPHAMILSRMENGDFVIDKERTTAGGRSSEGVAIYQIESQKIRRVWFTP